VFKLKIYSWNASDTYKNSRLTSYTRNTTPHAAIRSEHIHTYTP